MFAFILQKIQDNALVLFVATITVKKAFYAMKIVKSRLYNRIKNQWLNDSWIVYIKINKFIDIDNSDIIQRF